MKNILRLLAETIVLVPRFGMMQSQKLTYDFRNSLLVRQGSAWLRRIDAMLLPEVAGQKTTEDRSPERMPGKVRYFSE